MRYFYFSYFFRYLGIVKKKLFILYYCAVSHVLGKKKPAVFFCTHNDSSSFMDDAYSAMYFAKSYDISVSEQSTIRCTRKKCKNPTNCGFIPNYPKIVFSGPNSAPAAPWYSIERILEFV